MEAFWIVVMAMAIVVLLAAVLRLDSKCNRLEDESRHLKRIIHEDRLSEQRRKANA